MRNRWSSLEEEGSGVTVRGLCCRFYDKIFSARPLSLEIRIVWQHISNRELAGDNSSV